MALSHRRYWAELPLPLRAVMGVACAASLAGAISLAMLFTFGNLAFGAYHAAAGYASAGIRPLLEVLATVPAVLLAGSGMLALSLLLGFAIAFPVSAIAVAGAYLLLRRVRSPRRSVFGAIGFVVGALLWLWMWWNGPPGNVYFGSWMSMLAVGGVAGCAGGFTLARYFPRDTA